MSTENMRAIQDSEGPVSIEQKRMIKILVAQGWSKNEIIYEMQRIFGNDVLILPRSVDDERSFVAKTIPVLFWGLTIGYFAIRFRSRTLLTAANAPIKKTRVVRKKKEVNMTTGLLSKDGVPTDVDESEELRRKLRNK